MTAVAIIGGGIASIGAIAKIVEAEDCVISRVDQYLAPSRGAEIVTCDGTYRLPDSDECGYLQRWGAVLGLKEFDRRAFRAFSSVFLSDQILNQFESASQREQSTYESDDVQYLCMNRSDAIEKAARLVANAKDRGFFRQVQSRVSKLQKSGDSWQVRSEAAIDNGPYDRVVMCGGALLTPVLLFDSGLVGKRDTFKLQDHVIQFGRSGETTEENTLVPGNRGLQKVCSKNSINGSAHDVHNARILAFAPPYMEQIYWRIAGRTRRELFAKGQWDLIKVLFRAAISGFSIFRDHRYFRVTVHDHLSCDANLIIENGEPVVHWKSHLQPGAVSAFHFHGSLDDCPEIEGLESTGVHIGDLSVGVPLNGINNGCASFQAGYVGMSRALKHTASRSSDLFAD